MLRRWTIAAITLLLAAGILIGAENVPLSRWQVAGDVHAVEHEGNRIRLAATQPTTAGIVSPPIPISRGATHVLIGGVATAEQRGITLAAHSTDGETVGYWQNVLPMQNGTLAALLPTTSASPLRVFVGTHGQASSASIENITMTPVRQSMSARSTMYGALVHGENVEAQSFTARGQRLAAVRVLIRQLKLPEGPDLRVRIYPLDVNGVPQTNQPPLAETVVARSSTPTYEAGRIELIIAVSAATTPGKRYLVEFSTSADCKADNGFLLWGGPGDYADGCRFQNGSAVNDWDLHIETYDEI